MEGLAGDGLREISHCGWIRIVFITRLRNNSFEMGEIRNGMAWSRRANNRGMLIITGRFLAFRYIWIIETCTFQSASLCGDLRTTKSWRWPVKRFHVATSRHRIPQQLRFHFPNEIHSFETLLAPVSTMFRSNYRFTARNSLLLCPPNSYRLFEETYLEPHVKQKFSYSSILNRNRYRIQNWTGQWSVTTWNESRTS